MYVTCLPTRLRVSAEVIIVMIVILILIIIIIIIVLIVMIIIITFGGRGDLSVCPLGGLTAARECAEVTFDRGDLSVCPLGGFTNYSGP